MVGIDSYFQFPQKFLEGTSKSIKGFEMKNKKPLVTPFGEIKRSRDNLFLFGKLIIMGTLALCAATVWTALAGLVAG